MKIATFFLVTAVIILSAFTNLFSGTTGKLSGRITDSETGEPLIGANVLIEGTNYGAAADEGGYYVVINVPPGTYNVSAGYIGYQKAIFSEVNVSVDRTTKLDFELNPAALTTNEVVIQAKRPPVQKDRTYSSSVVNAETIQNLPVTSLSEVVALQPGVVSAGGTLHFRGGRSREVAYLIDGMPSSNSFSQGGGNNIVVENAMIEEVEVITGTFNAEYGSAQSGVVNIMTRRPSNTLSGLVSVYAGDLLSSQDDVFIGVDDFNPIAEKDVQLNLSGPIIADLLGFSISGRYSEEESRYWYERRFNPTDGWKIAAYQRWYQQRFADELQATQAITIPDSLATGDGALGPLSTYQGGSFSGKLDFMPMSAIRIGYQFFGHYSETLGPTGGALRYRRYQPDEFGTSRSWSNHHFLTFKHAPSDIFFYNIGFSFQHNDGESFYRKDNRVAKFPGDAGIQPISSNANGFSLGDTGGFYDGHGSDGKDFRQLFLITGDINWQIDRYNFAKAGFEIKKHKVNTYSWGYVQTLEWQNFKWPNQSELDASEYNFNQYWNALVNYWKNWEELYDAERYRKVEAEEYYLWRDYTIEPIEAAFYIQDKVEFGEIIFNAGLRFDAFLPQELVPKNYKVESFLVGSKQNLKDAQNRYQLSPRLGVSFPISANGVFHAAYGHFFQMPSFSKMFNEPLFALTPLQLEGRRLGNAELEPEKTVAYEIGLQQAISNEIAVDITTFYKDIKNLLGIERIVTSDAVGYERYINRDYGNVKGIALGLRKTSGFISGYINYTFQFAKGSSSDPDNLQLVESSTSIGGEPIVFIDRSILPLDWDQRHTLNSIVTFSQPADWSLSFIGSISSGLPYSPIFIDRYDIPEREFKNKGERPLNWNVDLKGIKHFNIAGFRTSLFLKIDNLLDNLNELEVFSSSGRATYNSRLPGDERIEVERLKQEGLFTLNEVDSNPTWYSSPRTVQVGLEFSF